MAIGSAATDVPPTTAPAPLHGRFTLIDALRGLAALWVAIHHFDRYGPLFPLADVWIPDFIEVFAGHGRRGVQMFFVISGFVIAYSIRKAWVTPAYLGNFALRRSLRLDPPYWSIIFLSLLMDAFSPLFGVVPTALDNTPEVGQVVAHVFYVQNILGYEDLSIGFWTLCIEVQFYLLLVILMGVAQRMTGTGSSREKGASGRSLLLLFGSLAVVSLFVFHPDHEAPLDFVSRIGENIASLFGGEVHSQNDDWLLRFFCMFFFGSLTWWTLEGRVAPVFYWTYVGLMAMRLILDEFWDEDIAIDLIIALGTGLLIYTAGRLGRLETWGNWRALQFLGRISYSLYLIHFPVMWIIVNVGYSLTGDSTVAALLWTILCLPASIAAAYLLYLCVEAPSVRFAARFK